MLRLLLTLSTLALLTGCFQTVPVDKPCGVLDDSLANVQATTSDGNRRIDTHFEAGVRAGCWGRDEAPANVELVR